MDRRILAALSLFSASATALITAQGQAIVVNNCAYDVSLNNVPAAGEGATAVSQTLAPGDSYSQYYTGLEGHHDGWSIKLAPVDDPTGQIIQFEYTYLPENPLFSNIIWFDMSFVNGDPFNNDWIFSSPTADCQSSLRHAAYMYSTDDFFGMQKPCASSDNVVLTICPSSDSSSGSTSSSGGILGGIIGGISSAINGAINGGSTHSAAAAPVVVTTQATAPTAAAPVTTIAAPAVVPSPATTAPAVLPVVQHNAPVAPVPSVPAAVAAPAPAASSDASDDSGALQFAAGPNGVNGAQPIWNNKAAAVQSFASSSSSSVSAAAAAQASEVSFYTEGNTVWAVQFATVNVYQTADAPTPTAAAAAHRRHLHRHQARGHHA